ncbi:helix-turn-helix domain-containing protein [Epilithonimonas sp. UC225_85]|uniref:helix-turn-helix domain-containing protein n=1 Tax=Epilithonimonas sp. UC225_85 TaxID=3350167 RepID=UPI0036D36E22
MMVNTNVYAQTKEDIASIRQETLQSIQQDSEGYQKFLDYYSRISLQETLVLKIKSQLIREDYNNAVISLFQLKKMVESNENAADLFQYHLMAYQINQILGIKNESSENENYIKKNYQNISATLLVELSVDFSRISFFSGKQKIKLINESLQHYIKDKNYFFASRAYFYLGNIYLSEGKVNLAEKNFKESAKLSSEHTPSDFSALYPQVGIAEIHLFRKQYSEAYDLLLPLKKILAASPDMSLQKEYYMDLALASAYHNNPEEVKWADSMLADRKQITEDSKAKGRALLASKLETDYLQAIENQKRFWNRTFYGIFIFFSVLLLGLFIFFRIKSKNIVEIKQETDPKIFNIPDKTEKDLLHKLNLYESSGNFTQKNISLKTLSQQLETNPRYLSEIVNKHKNTNFSTYINELRIDYILKKLKEYPDYRKYKVSYLAEECGFSSHSLFTMVFKNKVGVSPIDYIQDLEKIN